MKIGLGIGIPRQQSSSGGGASFDTDYQALLDAASGDLPSASVQTAQNTLVVDLKAAGVWAKLDVFYVFATDGGDDIRRRNWLSPASFQCTLFNSPTFTSLEGYTGNGTNMYINTGWVPSIHAVNYALNSCSLGAYNRTQDTVGGFFTSTRSFPTRRAGFYLDSSGNLRSYGPNDSGGLQTTVASSSTGLTVLNRISSTERRAQVNGNNINPGNATSVSLPDDSLFILCQNGNGSPENYTDAQVSIVFAGSDLTSQSSSLFTAIEKYMDAIGKGVVA